MSIKDMMASQII